jgi:hypothetical protein
MFSRLVGCGEFYGLIVIDRKIYAGGHRLTTRNLLSTAPERQLPRFSNGLRVKQRATGKSRCLEHPFYPG